MICKIILVFYLSFCVAADKYPACTSIENARTPAEMGPPAAGEYDPVNTAIDEKILPVISALCNLEKSCDAKMMNMTSKMKAESDGFYSVVSKLNGSLTNENAKIESKLERLNVTMQKTIDNLSTKLENSLEAKMQNLKAELISRMENLLSSTNAPTLPSTTAANLLLLRKQQGLCDVQYNNSCFWAIVHNNRDVIYTDAERLCKKSGGQVADIYDKQHYGYVVKYLRTKIPSSSDRIYIWIGTKFNRITRVATVRNGGQAFESWYPSSPYWFLSGPPLYPVFIVVRPDEDDIEQGMLNWKPTRRLHGAFCEI